MQGTIRQQAYHMLAPGAVVLLLCRCHIRNVHHQIKQLTTTKVHVELYSSLLSEK